MRVAVMAAGGLGGFLGAVLAKNGNDVTFIARGAHLDAIRARGLSVSSVKGDFSTKPAQATDDPARIGLVDWIIFAVKTYSSESAAAALAPLVGEGTTIVTVQNGVESFDQLAALYGKERVLAAPIQIEATLTAPGVIAQTSRFITLVTGEMSGTQRISPRVEWFVEQFKRHGIDASGSDNMPAPVWTKLLFLASFAGLTTLARTEGAILFQLPEARLALRGAMQEVFDVARAYGVNLPIDLVEQRYQFASKIEPGMTASMHKDILRGNRLEIDALSGAVVRLGAAKNIPTPVHQTIYAALKMEDDRARAKSI